MEPFIAAADVTELWPSSTSVLNELPSRLRWGQNAVGVLFCLLHLAPAHPSNSSDSAVQKVFACLAPSVMTSTG